ncbi:polynucleotide kinase [Roseibium album]|nr:polynucleotide kinase [Roseibium album]
MTVHRYDGPSFADLQALVPASPDWSINWDSVWGLWCELQVLDACQQDPIHHAEGDVGRHTRMVVEALVGTKEWKELDEAAKGCLFWAAVLHDVGKPATTKTEEDGRITSRGHSRVGAAIARQLLWHAGTPFYWREQLCGIISAHQLPFWLIERPDPERLAIESSWRCPADLLYLHAKADALGRECEDQNAVLDNVALARQVFEDEGCLTQRFAFSNNESRVAFFERPGRDPNYAAFETFRCKVTFMSGLPGAGKDTWIARNRQGVPVVSLDALRDELGVTAIGNQGRVVQAAYERAREHLRNEQDFVWNGTNVTAQLRAKPFKLFRDYNAQIEIVYIEPSLSRLRTQNRNRDAVVPENVLSNLIQKMEPPGDWEAHQILRVVGQA